MFLGLKVNTGKEGELLFLIDTGAGVSLLKGNKILRTTKYDPEGKLKVKCVDGSPMEFHRTVEAQVELRNILIMHEFQLMNKELDILCDGILGRDFFQLVKPKSAMKCGLQD
jgi:hypothetical protein